MVKLIIIPWLSSVVLSLLSKNGTQSVMSFIVRIFLSVYYDEKYSLSQVKLWTKTLFSAKSLPVNYTMPNSGWFASHSEACLGIRCLSSNENLPSKPKTPLRAAWTFSSLLQNTGMSVSKRISSKSEFLDSAALRYAVHDSLVTAAFSGLFLLKMASLFPAELDLGMITVQVEQLAQLLSDVAAER
jgi:hypothetical protein